MAPPHVASLPLLATHPLAVPEPSDLAIDETGSILWTVSDHSNKAYQLDPDGNVIKTLSYTGNDLEGVAYDARDHTLWLAEEGLRQVVHVDLTGAVLKKYDLSLTGEPNSGIEGICLDETGALFVLNEKHPGMFITLKPDVTIASMLGLTFAKDYSGMTYDPARHCFWIVSDQSAGIYLWNKSNQVLAEYALPSTKFEGIALDPAAKRVYVVNDSLQSMSVYQNTVPAAPLGAR